MAAQYDHAVIYFKFCSAKAHERVSISAPFISVANLKAKIMEKKKLLSSRVAAVGQHLQHIRPCRIGDKLALFDATTMEEYRDESQAIPMFTSVLVRRLPGHHPDVHQQSPSSKPSKHDSNTFQQQAAKSSPTKDQYSVVFEQDREQQLLLHHRERCTSDDHEDPDRKIQDFVNKSAAQHNVLQSQAAPATKPGYASIRRTNVSNSTCLYRNPPPPGYVCHRCGVGGHLIKYCPTNGDPAYDNCQVFMTTSSSSSCKRSSTSYMSMSSAPQEASRPAKRAAPLPNETLFDREMQGIFGIRISEPQGTVAQRSTADVDNILEELRCPLCQDAMKEAVVASNCCLKSYCDKCIRGYLLSNGMHCFCGAKGMLVDYLLPNKTLRDTICGLVLAAAEPTTTCGYSKLQQGDPTTVTPYNSSDAEKPQGDVECPIVSSNNYDVRRTTTSCTAFGNMDNHTITGDEARTRRHQKDQITINPIASQNTCTAPMQIGAARLTYKCHGTAMLSRQTSLLQRPALVPVQQLAF